MDFQARLEALTHQLRPWSALWSRSILQGWPESGAAYPEDWLDYARSLDETGERRLDQGELVGAAPPSLGALLGALEELTKLPWHEDRHPMTVSETQGLSDKKAHELARVLALLGSRTRFIQQAVDIGGGMGHLARLCARTFGWTFHSIDRDAALQDKGRQWLKRARSPVGGPLHFIQASVEDGPQPRIDPLFSGRDRASIGLHTCGPLALTQIRKSRGAGFVLNIGCCYDKLELPRDYPVSGIGREHPLPFTPHALALTTRGRPRKTEAEFARMKQVYAWRFAFHLLSKRQFPERDFVRAGDAPRALYDSPFASYALDRLERLGLSSNMTADELTAFEVSVRAETRDLLLCHLLRDRFARALEVVLLLDRAIFLEELGFEVELLQLFEPDVSPRNLALVASQSV
ncbi:Methyltransferase domain-containing protein [Myxococcus fulvus]|uniref:Methyltransferase domain-containing protein n=1 Tax=Myxococcus fulvus TaxID=33 RepID=A0A511T8S6_MYXFU|nr:methyltransferase [Myxococcus fulvus]GEN10574.1 hypothetical protein MFU01_56110 [Myxococcus fulvus]SET79529.1 Methyltransferase domain-containing protein [Myxococcus fulvus]